MRSFGGLPVPLLALVAVFTLPHAFAKDDDPSVKIEVTTPAGCSRPTRSGDKISVHYIGTLESTGLEFDQSYNRGSPFSFTLGAGQVIKGWEEGLLDMCPGEGRKLTIPPELAYGERGAPPAIPGGSTLVFQTELVDIVGVEQESLTFTTTATGADFSIATAPPKPPSAEEEGKEDESLPKLEGTPLTDTSDPTATQQGECHLLGPFALIVQGALGIVALLSLVVKRWRETPKRPWKIWFFDVSKQVVGSVLTHILNLVMSMLGAMEIMNAAAKAADKEEGQPKKPNPCSFYLLNLGIDTTLGIPVLYLLLKILHVAFLYTPLAKPPQSIKSGNYGQPPKVTWWLKQSLIYFIGLTGMKLFVLFLFAIFPWLPWVGDWALRWTEGNEAVQIAFAMFIFPLAMNGVQYWIIDNFIMDKERGKDGGHGYQQVQGHDDDDDDDDLDDETITVENDSVRGKTSEEIERPSLREANPTPIPDSEEDAVRGESSRSRSPQKEDAASKRS